MSPRFVLGRENVPCVAEVVNRSLKADCIDFRNMHKQGSKERGQAWKLIVENLNSNLSPSFRVSVRSVRDKFVKLIQKMGLLGTLLPTNMAATI